MLKLIFTAIICGSLLTGCAAQGQGSNTNSEYESTVGINVVPTLKDEVTADTVWCATFQLIWNDMKNEVVGQDIVFDPQKNVVENLNKESFKENMISEEYYYKKFGLKTLELKSEIEKGIKDKFDETSDILDDFDWSEEANNNPNDPTTKKYFFYTMLKRVFEFPKMFSKLEDGIFADKYENVKYFGIDSDSSNELDNQVKVLFYNSENEYAVTLKTKNKDEVILYKSPTGNTLEEIYSNLLVKNKNYLNNGNETYFNERDRLKVPYLSFKEKVEYEELENEPFFASDGDVCEIVKAIQMIEFELDEKGGKIKSEAGMAMIKSMSISPEEGKPRNFFFDDTFAIFLKEEDRELPYFGAVISDITKYQK